ncbi:ParA family protein [bacterium]|nr:MAG: ParA family protein [bacterium]
MILSVINQKGGVGKTTTAVNLAAALAQWGHPTLLVDLDPQGNATSGCGVSASDFGGPSLYEALVAIENERAKNPGRPVPSAPVRPGIAKGPMPLLSVIGASPELAGSEIELATNPRRDGLKQIITSVKNDYQFVIVDTPPSLSILTVNSLVAADRLVIPVQCEYYALEGLGQLLRTLEKIRRFLNPDLSVMGLLRTMFDGRVALSGQVSNELEKHFPQLLFKTAIPRNVRLAEAPSFGKPVMLHDKRSIGADAYRRLGVEVMSRAGVAPVKP